MPLIMLLGAAPKSLWYLTPFVLQYRFKVLVTCYITYTSILIRKLQFIKVRKQLISSTRLKEGRKPSQKNISYNLLKLLWKLLPYHDADICSG